MYICMYVNTDIPIGNKYCMIPTSLGTLANKNMSSSYPQRSQKMPAKVYTQIAPRENTERNNKKQ